MKKNILLNFIIFFIAFFFMEIKDARAIDYPYDECVSDESCLLLCTYVNNMGVTRVINIYYFFDGDWSVDYNNGFEKGSSSYYGDMKDKNTFSKIFGTSGSPNVYNEADVEVGKFYCPKHGYFDRQAFPEICFDNDGKTCENKSGIIATLFGHKDSGFVSDTLNYNVFDHIDRYIDEMNFDDLECSELASGDYDTDRDIKNKFNKDFYQNFLYGNEIPPFIAYYLNNSDIANRTIESFKNRIDECRQEIIIGVDSGAMTPADADTQQTNLDNLNPDDVGDTMDDIVQDMVNVENTLYDNVSCDTLLGDPDNDQTLAYWLQWILDIMKYIAIIALLVLSTIDFVKAIVQDDKDALRKALLTTGKRTIYAVLIFFLPIIVEVLMKMLGAYGTCGIG